MKLTRREMAEEHIAPEEYFDASDDDSGHVTLVMSTPRWEQLGRPETIEVTID